MGGCRDAVELFQEAVFDFFIAGQLIGMHFDPLRLAKPQKLHLSGAEASSPDIPTGEMDLLYSIEEHAFSTWYFRTIAG